MSTKRPLGRKTNDMDRWSGRVALITGASVGIGACLTERLVKHGMKVVGCARNIEKIQELAEKLKDEKGSLLSIKCNLKHEQEIFSMFEEIKKTYGGVDVCINNAGLAHSATLISGETEKWRDVLDINVLALSICTREAVQSMKSRGVDDGHIIHLGSIMGHVVWLSPSSNMYTASKYAVRALTEGLRMELRQMKSNIRISCISPGIVRTELVHRMENDYAFGENFYNSSPHLLPDDVADAVIYALSAPPHVQVHDVIVKPTNEVR